MRGVCVQRVHQRRAFEYDPNPRVAMTVDPPFVAFRQAKPALQIKIVPDLFKRVLADEQAGEEAQHHRRHLMLNRVVGRLESIDQLLEPFLTVHAVFGPGVKGRCHFRDHFDVFSDYLLLLRDFVKAALDASGQSAELRFRKPPFFASKFRWIDS